MKFLLIRNRENGEMFYCISKGIYYSPVSHDQFWSALKAHFGSKLVLPTRSRAGVYDLTEFVSGSPCEKNLPPLTN